IEPEMAFYEHEDSLKVQEQYVEYIVTDVLEHCQFDLEALDRDTSILRKIKAPFPRITYTDAIELLKDKGFDDIEWGEDFGAPHETEIANHFDLPVFIVNRSEERRVGKECRWQCAQYADTQKEREMMENE